MRAGKEGFINEGQKSGLEGFPSLPKRELPESSPPAGSSDGRVWSARRPEPQLLGNLVRPDEGGKPIESGSLPRARAPDHKALGNECARRARASSGLGGRWVVTS